MADLAAELDKGGQTDTILLHCSKAFDKVSHERLPPKLYFSTTVSVIPLDHFIFMFAKKKLFCQSLGDPAPLTAICHLRPLPVSVLKLHRVALGWRLAASVRVLVWENRTVSSANSRPLALMPSPKSLT